MAVRFENEIPSVEEYWGLFQTTGWNDEYRLSAADLHRSLYASWYVSAAYEEGGRLVGFGRLVSDGVLHAMVYELMVAPDQQNLGIGTAILAELVRFCQDHEIRDIQLFCAHGKREFYEKRGFITRPEDAPGMQYRKS